MSSLLWYLLCFAVGIRTDITIFAHFTVVINVTDNFYMHEELFIQSLNHRFVFL